jgi:hypothetical protein
MAMQVLAAVVPAISSQRGSIALLGTLVWVFFIHPFVICIKMLIGMLTCEYLLTSWQCNNVQVCLHVCTRSRACARAFTTWNIPWLYPCQRDGCGNVCALGKSLQNYLPPRKRHWGFMRHPNHAQAHDGSGYSDRGKETCHCCHCAAVV